MPHARAIDIIIVNAKQIANNPQLLQVKHDLTIDGIDLLKKLSPDFKEVYSQVFKLVSKCSPLGDSGAKAANQNMVTELIGLLHRDRILNDASDNYIDLVLALLSLKARTNSNLDLFINNLGEALKTLEISTKDREVLEALQIMFTKNTENLSTEINFCIDQYIRAAAIYADSEASVIKEQYEMFYNNVNAIVNPPELTLERFEEVKQQFLNDLTVLETADRDMLIRAFRKIFMAKDIAAVSDEIAHVYQSIASDFSTVLNLKRSLPVKSFTFKFSENPVIRFLQQHVGFIREFFKHKQQKYFKRDMIDKLISDIDTHLSPENNIKPKLS